MIFSQLNIKRNVKYNFTFFLLAQMKTHALSQLMQVNVYDVCIFAVFYGPNVTLQCTVPSVSSIKEIQMIKDTRGSL